MQNKSDIENTNLQQKISDRIPCALCGRMNDRPLMDIYDPVKQDGQIYHLVKCADCDLVYLSPRPLLEGDRAENHPEEYWQKRNLSQKIKANTIIARAKRTFLRLLYTEEIGHIKKWVPQGGRILEIGCGNGDFLAILKRMDYETVGIDPDPICYKVAKGRHSDLEIYNKTLDTIQFESGSFDIVFMNHVFEHIHNPNETLKEIRRILKDDGKLLFCIPSIDSYQFRIFKERYFNFCAPQHLYMYSPSTLQRLLEKNGFSKVFISHQSIRCNSPTWVWSLFPELNPISLVIHNGEKGIWLKHMLSYFLSLLFIPVAFLEGLSGHGACIFFLAKKKSN